MSDQVTCKDCKHSTRGLALNERIGSWASDPSGKFLKCQHSLKKEVMYNPVNGHTVIKQELDYCSTQRKFDHDDLCGTNGRYWVPKHKKDLFKLMTRIGNETN
jgi:hypothetical protein